MVRSSGGEAVIWVGYGLVFKHLMDQVAREELLAEIEQAMADLEWEGRIIRMERDGETVYKATALTSLTAFRDSRLATCRRCHQPPRPYGACDRCNDLERASRAFMDELQGRGLPWIDLRAFPLVDVLVAAVHLIGPQFTEADHLLLSQALYQATDAARANIVRIAGFDPGPNVETLAWGDHDGTVTRLRDRIVLGVLTPEWQAIGEIQRTVSIVPGLSIVRHHLLRLQAAGLVEHESGPRRSAWRLAG